MPDTVTILSGSDGAPAEQHRTWEVTALRQVVRRTMRQEKGTRWWQRWQQARKQVRWFRRQARWFGKLGEMCVLTGELGEVTGQLNKADKVTREVGEVRDRWVKWSRSCGEVGENGAADMEACGAEWTPAPLKRWSTYSKSMQSEAVSSRVLQITAKVKVVCPTAVTFLTPSQMPLREKPSCRNVYSFPAINKINGRRNFGKTFSWLIDSLYLKILIKKKTAVSDFTDQEIFRLKKWMIKVRK